jgi:formylmethanofuran dehydrogenase subunit B
VFIPIATPGIGAAGDLFRADGGVCLPLDAVLDDGLPKLPDVLAAITRRVQELKA